MPLKRGLRRLGFTAIRKTSSCEVGFVKGETLYCCHITALSKCCQRFDANEFTLGWSTEEKGHRIILSAETNKCRIKVQQTIDCSCWSKLLGRLHVVFFLPPAKGRKVLIVNLLLFPLLFFFFLRGIALPSNCRHTYANLVNPINVITFSWS